MREWVMQVGNIAISAISDGTFIARPGYFGDGASAPVMSRDMLTRIGFLLAAIGNPTATSAIEAQ
jgi:hypothetical protein